MTSQGGEGADKRIKEMAERINKNQQIESSMFIA